MTDHRDHSEYSEAFRAGFKWAQQEKDRDDVALRILCGLAANPGKDWQRESDPDYVGFAYQLADAFISYIDPCPHDHDPNPDPHQGGEPS